MTTIRPKSSIVLPVQISAAPLSKSVSREALLFLLRLLTLPAGHHILPLTHVPGAGWILDGKSKARSSARRSLNRIIPVLSDLEVQIFGLWQPIFDQLDFEEDLLSIELSAFVSDMMTKPVKYGRVDLAWLSDFKSTATIRLACFISAYENRYHQEVELSISDFANILCIKGEYKRYSNFKSKILTPIFEEYNDSDCKFYASFEAIRAGLGGAVRSVIISIRERKPSEKGFAPKILQPIKLDTKPTPWTKEEEINILINKQKIYGAIIPNFSVQTIVESLQYLGGDVKLLNKLIVDDYHPTTHNHPDAWLRAKVQVTANMMAAAMEYVPDPEVEAIFDDLIRRRQKPDIS